MRIDSRPVVFAGSLVVLVAMASGFFGHTVDDAFISFRYADNLVAGHGLVFNPGERVEGYTNFLWCLLLAPPIAASIDPEPVSKVLGMLAAIGLLAGVVRFGPRVEGQPWVAWVAPLLTAASPPLAVWATGGLEAPLFACWVVWAVGLTWSGLAADRLHPGGALCAAGAALTRPEGVGVFTILVACVVLLRWRTRRPGRVVGRTLRWAGWFALVFVPYFAWRWSYYGELLPNTFHAKVGFNLAQVGRGLAYHADFFQAGGLWLVLPLVGLVWCRDRTAAWLWGGMAAGLAAYVAAVGGDGLPMFRFLVPALPPLFLLAGHAASGLATRFEPRRGWVAGAVCVALAALTARAAFVGPAARYVERDRREVRAWEAMGRYFAAHSRPGDSIGVIAAGAVPYRSGLVAIDMLGLNDPAIARREMPELGRGEAGHEKYDVEYVLDREPTFMLIGAYGMADRPIEAHRLVQPYYAAETEMLRSPRFRASYRLARASTPLGWFAFFVRADVARTREPPRPPRPGEG